MRRLSLILMLLATGGIATGGLDFLHQRQHQRQTREWIAAVHAAAAKHGRVPIDPPPAPRGAANCAICQALHVPITARFSHSAVPLTERTARGEELRPVEIYAEHIHLQIHLRGPPVV